MIFCLQKLDSLSSMDSSEIATVSGGNGFTGLEEIGGVLNNFLSGNVVNIYLH